MNRQTITTLLFVGTLVFARTGMELAADQTSAGKHWAYVPPVRPSVPEVKRRDWPKNPIDAFVLAKLEDHGLEPSPEAERARLIRRLYLDLVGIPPSVEEVDAFLENPRADAYEVVVDRLLASPSYGEHWARHWLDLARYADSNGFQRDGHRSAWPYRDWVIRALNDDMPFDRFSIEQLAGDLLPHATIDQKIATGFHRSTTVNVEAGVDREEDRINAVIDRLNTTGTVWLGTTIGCAQCHNHKYDPITQKEYYRLFAYFNNTEIETSAGSGSVRQFVGPRMKVPEAEGREKERQQVRALLTRKKKELEREIARAKRAQGSWEQELLSSPESLERLSPNIRDTLTASSRTTAQRRNLTDFYLGTRTVIRKGRREIAKLEKLLATLAPPTTLTMVELKTPRVTKVFRRGNFLQPGSPVEAGVPEVLHPLAPDAPANRLGLARWLCNPRNPLVGRVTVNRWWGEFFGRGLVATPEDFGSQGDPPTHPGLLDWLATELVRQGWSMKAIHRLIVTSATYRQSSRFSRTAHLDPDGRLYSRGPRFRMEAERIRDNALAISGLLHLKMGGPPVRPPQPDGIWNVTGVVDNTYRTSEGVDRYRRGIYTVWRRSSPYPSFVTFDAPDRGSTCVRRPRTNTPLQALTLMNDPVYVEAAFALADRILRAPIARTSRGEGGPEEETTQRAVYGFRLCVARRPSREEADELRQIYRRERELFERKPEALEKLLAGRSLPSGVDRCDLGAWFYVATILLNLDETITKN